MKAIINKIIPFSSVDGPGNRTAIFFQGCNFDCAYCHNPETINRCIGCGACIKVCPVEALEVVKNSGEIKQKVVWNEEKCVACDECIKICKHYSTPKTKEMTVEEVLSQIKKYSMFIQGITVSGGECSLQLGFIKELFKEVKKMGLTTFMDTNGYIPLWKDKELLDVMDKAMIDIKSINPDEHLKLVGKENYTVIENLKELGKRGKVFEIRTVVVPKLLQNENTINEASKIVAVIEKGIKLNSNLDINKDGIRYKIIKYRNLGVRDGRVNSCTPTEDYMDKLKKIAENNGCLDIITV